MFSVLMPLDSADAGLRMSASAGTTHAASSAIRSVIFDVPAPRSRNTIGISTTRRPRRSARWVSSTWNA